MKKINFLIYFFCFFAIISSQLNAQTTFTAPPDLCITDGIQTGLTGGLPVGGVYTGTGVTDDGNGSTYTFDPNAGGAGTTTITYTESGIPASDDVEVVLPLNPPTLADPGDFCLNAGVQTGLGGGDALGQTVTNSGYVGPGVTDDGNQTTYSFDPAAAGVGIHNITFVIFNECGGVPSNVITIEVFALPTVTFTAPADLCVNAGVQLGLGGGLPTGGLYSGPGVTDDGNGTTYTFDPAAGGPGTYPIQYGFINANGCINTATDDLEVFALPTVTFTAPASPICPNTVLTGLSGGTPTGGVYFGSGVTDDGNGTTYTLDTAGLSGDITITYIFTDGNGCTNNVGDIVTVVDNIAPTITCVADGTRDTTLGVCGYLVIGTEFDATFTDNCTGGSITNSINGTATIAGEFLPLGDTTVTWTATDGSGNPATCTTTITVEDNTPPQMTCAPAAIRSTDPGLCEYTVQGTEFDASAGDPCGINPATFINDFTGTNTVGGAVLPQGTTIIEWTATDNNGNTSTCTTQVIVLDGEAPVITCPANVTVSNDPGQCDAVVTFAPTATDNCPGVTTSSVPASGSVFPVGTTLVTVTATDASGNTDVCTFNVTVNDTEPPVANCVAPFTLQLDVNGMASITVADVDNMSTDNCGIATTTIAPSAFTCADVGPNTVTLTVTDIHGNVSTCTTTVTVEDNVPPVAVCLNIDVFLDATGTATITPADVDGGSTDACGIASLAIDIDTFTCDADLGPNDVLLTVTDNNGNVSTCIAVVTVIDNIDPVIACPADIAVNTDPSVCFAEVTFPDALALDNCTVTVAQTGGLPSGSMFPVGVSTVTYTATDSSGNTAVCSFTITVTDNEPPMAVCQDITIQLDANGDAMIVVGDVDGGSTDNCGVASTSIDIDTFDCSDVGPNDVTLTVTDVNGNVSTCIAVVTVEDVTPPVAVCMDITVQLDPTGTVTILGSDVAGASTDACGIASYDLDIDTFDCSNVGPNTVTVTITDVNGNVSTCTAVVTVEDNVAPDLVCMDITLELGADGTATITPADVIDTSADACGILTSGVDITDFDCSDIGTPVIVTVFVVDNNGNSSACTAVVTVVDLLAPVVTCPADIAVDPGPGNLFYEVPDYFATGEATAVDNCTDPLTILSQDPAPGTLLSDGVYTVTMTAEDEYGNVGTCTFELTVESVLGINDNEVSLATIVMYPNPARDYVTLSNPQSVDLDHAVIFDVNGRLIQTIDLTNMGIEKVIDVTNLNAAVYTVVIRSARGQISKQLLKE